jgi:co-chaperonin GroES (HSP10)
MIKAIKNRIFLKKDKYPEKIGSLYVPNVEGQHAPPYSGIVISIGSDVVDSDIQLGCRVLFHDLSGTEFSVNGEDIFSINDTDILAIILDKNIKIA